MIIKYIFIVQRYHARVRRDAGRCRWDFAPRIIADRHRWVGGSNSDGQSRLTRGPSDLLPPFSREQHLLAIRTPRDNQQPGLRLPGGPRAARLQLRPAARCRSANGHPGPTQERRETRTAHPRALLHCSNCAFVMPYFEALLILLSSTCGLMSLLHWKHLAGTLDLPMVSL